jgi:hypothetical protein
MPLERTIMPKAVINSLLFILAALTVLHGAAAAQGPASQDLLTEYFQQTADYDINCSLDIDAKMLTGTERITYTNNSPDTLKRYFIHLYPNAWRSKDSELYQDYFPGTWDFISGLPEENRGWIEIDTLTVGGEPANFRVRGTILTGNFARPLAPGATVVFDMTFREKIRKRIGRSGYVGNHYDMAQWYPKMAVYDKTGWHDDQFRMGEFYGEFGTYDVTIELPNQYVIAATGLPLEGDPGWTRNEKPEHSSKRGGGFFEQYPPGSPEASLEADASGMKNGRDNAELSRSMKTVHFRAVNVHDFAWSADPLYVVEETQVGDYSVRSFYRQWNRAWADSVLARTVNTMKWLDETVGPYEWPQISIVDVPARGGMEYPMLVMNGSPDKALIIHEVTHMWFYGMLANNEREEAWLDEGPAQYNMFNYLIEQKGRKDLWKEISRPVIDLHRRGYAEPVATPHQEFKSGGQTMIYDKSALFFRALKYRVGEENFNRILKEYYSLWKFRHVDEEAFRAVCEDVTGADLDDFFKQWIHSAKDCDYSLTKFTTREEDGVQWADVSIERKGEMIMPLTLEFDLGGGRVVTEQVDGMAREIEKSFSFDSRPKSVSINPDNEILDIYQLDNNSYGRTKLALENPWRYEWPRASRLLEFMPIGWYNEIDGIKAGLRLKSSYDETYNRIILQGLYSEKSGRIDGYLKFSNPVSWLGRENTLNLEGYYREGRGGASFVLDKIQKSSLSDPMPKYWQLRFVYYDLFDDAYVYPGTYEKGTNLYLGGGLKMAPKMDILATSLNLDFDRSFWGSKDSYEKFSVDARIWSTHRLDRWLKPKLRLWYGTSNIDPPAQEKLNLAGAGVREKEQYFWLRSVGAFPEDHYNNWVLPGNSNLRGYFNGDYAFKRSVAVNAELGLPFWVPRFLKPSLKDRQLYLFYDAGTVLDDRPFEALPAELAESLDPNYFNGWFQDFGIGIRIWAIKAEVPLYLSHPDLVGDEEQWAPRWTIGIDTLF